MKKISTEGGDNLFFKSIFTYIIIRLIFDLLFKQLYKFKPQVLLPLINMVLEKWKGNQKIKWIAILILVFICVIIAVQLRLSDILTTILVAFFVSLCELLFNEPKGVEQ